MEPNSASGRSSKWVSAVLIFIYTAISNSVFTVSIFALPFMTNCFPVFPSIPTVSALLSVAKITSSILIFFFPNHPIRIMVIFACKAVLVGVLSEMYSFFPPHWQGTWVAVLLVFLAFSCGSTVARALTIADTPRETLFLSYAYTLGKQSVHLVELLATSSLFSLFCWDGVAVLVIVSYSIVAIVSVVNLLLSPSRASKGQGYQPINGDEVSRIGVESSSDCSSDSYSSQDFPEDSGIEEVLDRNSPVHLKATSTPNEKSRLLRAEAKPASDHKKLDESVSIMTDLIGVPIRAWALIMSTEMVTFTIGVISLSGVMFVKDTWHFNPVSVSLVIFLPQVVVIPCVFLLACVKLKPFSTLTIAMFAMSCVGLIPLSQGYEHGYVIIGIIVFVCELFNALRLNSQMAAFSCIVDSSRIAKRFVTISTLLSFTFRTVGLSFGSFLYHAWSPSAPFILSGCVQLLGSLIVLLVHKTESDTFCCNVLCRAFCCCCDKKHVVIGEEDDQSECDAALDPGFKKSGHPSNC